MKETTEEKRQQLIDDSALLLDRIEAHGFELDRRICVLRSSGDPIELPIDLEALVRIANFCFTANEQLNRISSVLTTDQDYAMVNEGEDSGQEIPESGPLITVEPFSRERNFLHEEIRSWQNALNVEQNLNREQSRVIANLVQLLASAGAHNELQRQSFTGVDSDDARHALQGVESGHEADSESGGGTPRYSGANAL